jgi:RNase P subunit RPR2
MLITQVCLKPGCNGNTFHVNTADDKLLIKCTVCGEEYLHEDELDHVVAPTCSKCDNEAFKVFRNNKTNKVYLNCTKCNSIPRFIYLDEEGKQVSYEQLNIRDIKRSLEYIADRLDNAESK